MSPEEEIVILKQRIDMLEQIIYAFVYPDRYQFNRNVFLAGSKIGFFTKPPVTRHAAIASPSLATVSGSGADTDINNNFTNMKNAVDTLRTTLSGYGLTA